MSDDEIPTFIDSGLAAWREGAFLHDPVNLANVAGACREAIRDQALRLERTWQREQRGLPPADEDLDVPRQTALPIAALECWLDDELDDEELDAVLSDLIAMLRDHRGPRLKSV